MTITSAHNDKLTQIRKLHQRRRWRERSGRFVAAGEDLLAAADAAGWPAVERYCAAGSALGGVEIEPRILASLSGLASGTRALAVYEERWTDPPLGPLCVYLHGVQDPGNVGAILRSAQAFGASSVALGPGTADPFGPKAVRASMGAVFAVPLARSDGDLGPLPGATIALHPDSGPRFAELWRSGSEGWNQNAKVREVTLLIGAEREGLPDELVARADHVARIPIATNSLNAAMAATVALYEVTRMAG
jgi:RNA methyltransferase, TrmH family